MSEARMHDTAQKLIFERSRPGRVACSLPPCDVPEKEAAELIPPGFLRAKDPALPELYEVDVIRHYTALSRRNFGVDNGFYPLGSCTMKYNPKINEDVARLPGFAKIHPYQSEESVQGALELLYSLQEDLAEITGMDQVSLQPAAGAHGEFTGLMMIRAYHESRGETRPKVIVPDSSHGTNPASAAVAGFEIVTIPSNERGLVDLDALRSALGTDTAALMLTNPNTLRRGASESAQDDEHPARRRRTRGGARRREGAARAVPAEAAGEAAGGRHVLPGSGSFDVDRPREGLFRQLWHPRPRIRLHSLAWARRLAARLRVRGPQRQLPL
jgi:hypothetical protein